MRPASGFFNKSHNLFSDTLASSRAKSKRELVDIGGKPDSGIRAVATAMVDFALSFPTISAMNKWWHYYTHYFPSDKASDPLIFLQEMTVNPQRLGQFINELTYVLEQLVLNEFNANPQDYRGVFIEKNTAHDRSTHCNAIAALAKLILLPIKVNVVEPTKELYLSLHYFPLLNQSKSGLTLQVQCGHYLPLLSRPESFKTLKFYSELVVFPVKAAMDHEVDKERIWKRINDVDQAFLKPFHSNLRRLTTMFCAGEISKADLLSVYIQGLSNPNYHQAATKNVGIEHGNQHFFETINHQSGVQGIILPRKNDHNQQLVKELIHAIARGIAVNQFNEDTVYAQLAPENACDDIHSSVTNLDM